VVDGIERRLEVQKDECSEIATVNRGHAGCRTACEVRPRVRRVVGSKARSKVGWLLGSLVEIDGFKLLKIKLG
jgi:hypothetical protein